MKLQLNHIGPYTAGPNLTLVLIIQIVQNNSVDRPSYQRYIYYFTIFQNPPGAISVTNKLRDLRAKAILSVNYFNINEAEFGGAIYITSDDRSLTQNYLNMTRFQNNKASIMGQSVYSNEAFNLKDIFVEAKGHRDVFHVHFEAAPVRLHNISINLKVESAIFFNWVP